MAIDNCNFFFRFPLRFFEKICGLYLILLNLYLGMILNLYENLITLRAFNIDRKLDDEPLIIKMIIGTLSAKLCSNCSFNICLI